MDSGAKFRAFHIFFRPPDSRLLSNFLDDGGAYYSEHSYLNELSVSNGCRLFGQSIALYGVHLGTEPFRGLGVPGDIINENLGFRMATKKQSDLITGCCVLGDTQKHYVERADGSCYCALSDGELVFEAASLFEAMQPDLNEAHRAFGGSL